jgi:hypothetical protein
MLRESPQQRPNIYQVIAEVCSMRHRSVPIKDVREQHEPKLHSLIRTRSTRAEHNPKLGEPNSYLPASRTLPLLLWWVYRRLRQSSRCSRYQTSHP